VNRIRAIGTLATVIVVAFAVDSARGDEPLSQERFDTIVLDAGHGGEDDGARGARGLVEKELVLDVGQRVAVRLRKHKLRVVMTRDDDRFVPLEERFAIANDARGDLFVSIHANAAENSSVRGVETFFLAVDASDEDARRVASRENEAFGGATGLPDLADPLSAILGDLIFSDYMNESNEFARLAQRGLANEDPSNSRGVKQAPFVVLQGVQMPSSLVEIGFVTNAAEEKRLRTSRARDRIAKALVAAVLEFGEHFDARRGVGQQSRSRFNSYVHSREEERAK
jgi:N-acetylmuramoyl-L-alanine amidase